MQYDASSIVVSVRPPEDNDGNSGLQITVPRNTFPRRDTKRKLRAIVKESLGEAFGSVDTQRYCRRNQEWARIATITVNPLKISLEKAVHLIQAKIIENLRHLVYRGPKRRRQPRLNRVRPKETPFIPMREFARTPRQ